MPNAPLMLSGRPMRGRPQPTMWSGTELPITTPYRLSVAAFGSPSR